MSSKIRTLFSSHIFFTNGGWTWPFTLVCINFKCIRIWRLLWLNLLIKLTNQIAHWPLTVWTTSIGFTMGGRSYILGRITSNNFNLGHHLDVKRSFDYLTFCLRLFFLMFRWTYFYVKQMSKYKRTACKLQLQRKYDLAWSIALRVGINVTVTTSVDLVDVCIF